MKKVFGMFLLSLTIVSCGSSHKVDDVVKRYRVAESFIWEDNVNNLDEVYEKNLKTAGLSNKEINYEALDIINKELKSKKWNAYLTEFVKKNIELVEKADVEESEWIGHTEAQSLDLLLSPAHTKEARNKYLKGHIKGRVERFKDLEKIYGSVDNALGKLLGSVAVMATKDLSELRMKSLYNKMKNTRKSEIINNIAYGTKEMSADELKRYVEIREKILPNNTLFRERATTYAVNRMINNIIRKVSKNKSDEKGLTNKLKKLVRR